MGMWVMVPSQPGSRTELCQNIRNVQITESLILSILVRRLLPCVSCFVQSFSVWLSWYCVWATHFCWQLARMTSENNPFHCYETVCCVCCLSLEMFVILVKTLTNSEQIPTNRKDTISNKWWMTATADKSEPGSTQRTTTSCLILMILDTTNKLFLLSGVSFTNCEKWECWPV